MIERSTEAVFADHLALAATGGLDTDIARNFASDCVLLTTYGRFEGHVGVRRAAELLERQLGPGASYRYLRRETCGEIAFLEWAAEGPCGSVGDGADSFLIRGSQIRVMTIHYRVCGRPDATR